MRDVTDAVDVLQRVLEISTHTSHAGRDVCRLNAASLKSGFLLTRPMRDVTKGHSFSVTLWLFLLTRPMRDV